MLTQEYVKELFNYDPETGILTWRIRPATNVSIGEEAGGHHPKDGRRLKINGRGYPASVIIWLWFHGHWPEGPPNEVIDHIDRNPWNNRIHNLRLITSEQNSWNRYARWDNPNKQTGVSYRRDSGKYRAYIYMNYKMVTLGQFATLEEATEARKQAEMKYRGEFAPKG